MKKVLIALIASATLLFIAMHSFPPVLASNCAGADGSIFAVDD